MLAGVMFRPISFKTLLGLEAQYPYGPYCTLKYGRNPIFTQVMGVPFRLMIKPGIVRYYYPPAKGRESSQYIPLLHFHRPDPANPEPKPSVGLFAASHRPWRIKHLVTRRPHRERQSRMMVLLCQKIYQSTILSIGSSSSSSA